MHICFTPMLVKTWKRNYALFSGRWLISILSRQLPSIHENCVKCCSAFLFFDSTKHVSRAYPSVMFYADCLYGYSCTCVSLPTLLLYEYCWFYYILNAYALSEDFICGVFLHECVKKLFRDWINELKPLPFEINSCFMSCPFPWLCSTQFLCSWKFTHFAVAISSDHQPPPTRRLLHWSHFDRRSLTCEMQCMALESWGYDFEVEIIPGKTFSSHSSAIQPWFWGNIEQFFSLPLSRLQCADSKDLIIECIMCSYFCLPLKAGGKESVHII